MDAQPIWTVPYALSLRPGALIEGTTLNDPYNSIFVAHNLSTSTGSAAIYGLSQDGIGIYARSESTTAPALQAISNFGPALGISGGIRIYNAGVNTHTPAFIHQVTAANICNGYWTVIDNSLINNKGGAILLVTYRDNNNLTNPVRSPVGVAYLTTDACGTGSANHWIIYDLAASPQEFEVGQQFNVLAVTP